MDSLYITFPAPGQVAVCKEPAPTPQPGELLCRAERSLISSGTELNCLRGVFEPGTNWAEWVRYPFRPGYSMVGRVVALGEGVTQPHVGDRVVAWAPHQRFYTTTPAAAHPVPDGLTAEEGTWGVLACTTQLAVRRAELELGESVGVVGLGMLGQLVAQYLLVAGARRVIAVDPVQRRLAMAEAHGATHVILGTAAEAHEPIATITGGRMLDAVWDVTGHPDALAECIALLRPRGRLILTGDTPTPSQQHLGPGVVSNSIAILGVHGTSSAPHYSAHTPWTQREITALFYDYVLQGRMRVADLITHRHRPEEAPAVYGALLADRTAAMGVVLEWGDT